MAIEPRTHNDYTVGWVCALPKERTAAIAMLDQRHADLPKPPNDHNTYTLGSIGNHNIVIACLPKGKIGPTPAATVAIQMINTFPSIKFGLMVGIGGGIPRKVRLGDVVVSVPVDEYPGVVQWDLGKAEQGYEFKRTGTLNNPPTLLLTALANLESENEIAGPKMPRYLDELKEKWPRLVPKYLRPDSTKDVLFKANYHHISENCTGEHTTPDHSDGDEDEEEECCQYCDKTQVVKRRPRDMCVHYGLIASGNSNIKDSALRDTLRRQLGDAVRCVEMEAAGLMDNFPCIVIRGICDYADSHKNKIWQEHAAAVAAAFTKELLGYVQSDEVDRERSVKDVISHVDEIKREVGQIRSSQTRKEDLEVLNWLTPINYGPQQTDYLRRRQPGTGQWLFNCEQYQKWLKETNETLFLDDLDRRFYAETTVGIAYIYCNFNRKDEQKPEDLISSLLKQLLQRQLSLPSTLRDLYNRHSPKETRPTLDEVSKILQSVAAIFSRTFIMVDALDECQTSDDCRRQFLSEVFNLRTKAKANVFATSRSIPEVMEEFKDSLTIEVRANEGDIRKYLNDRMPQLSRFVIERSDLQDEISSRIAKAADGIGKDTPKALRKALQNLVTGSDAYDAAYNAAMERIEKQLPDKKKRAKQVLSWITFAKRPLTEREFQHALAVETDESELDEENLPQVEDMISLCAGLVTVDEESSIIRLVHYTTQQYFNRTQDRWFRDAQLNITTTCTTYLSFSVFANGYCHTDEEFEQRLKSNPLYDYAARNWGYHARAISTCENYLPFLQKPAQVTASGQVLIVSDKYRYRGYSQKFPREITALHLAAYFGLHKAVESLIRENNPDIKDGFGQTPLSWAAKNGHEAVIELLLATKKVDPDSKSNYGKRPVSWAAENGHEAVVKLLLDTEKVDPNSKSNYGKTPLSLAAGNGHEAVVKLLLATKKVDPDSKTSNGKTPLSLAAENGHEAVVKLLLATEKVEPIRKII
ncbi:hypothetical protein DL770_008217 [Monosporascus sp. CRB-9-2]|nr:hypothetical protein DL770_008217 [Monosporascus sp. CRB-9-2]